MNITYHLAITDFINDLMKNLKKVVKKSENDKILLNYAKNISFFFDRKNAINIKIGL